MRASTVGKGAFRKDMRGRSRPRFSQRAAPATGPDRLKAGPSRAIYEHGEFVRMEQRGHFTTEQMRELNRRST